MMPPAGPAAANGDFLALLPGPLFPTGAASGAGAPAVEGTTVFAFRCAAGVLVAGDHRATAGNVVFSDRTEKILPLDGQSVMAIAGSPAMAFEMVRVLQTAFEFYRRSQLQPMSLAAKLRALSRLLRDNLPATLQGVGLVAPLFAGLDEERRAQVHFYDPLGAQFEAVDFAASGSGAGSIRAVLHFLAQHGPRPESLDLPAAIRLANRLLLTAAHFDTATGGVRPDRGEWATLQLLAADGLREVPAAEQAAAWHESAA